MANAKYAQVPSMAGSGQLNWRSDPIYALLMKGATYNAAHKFISEVSGATQIGSSLIPGRYMGENGEAYGGDASFSHVPKEQAYQVLVVKDVGTNDPMLLVYFDTDTEDATLQLINNGTYIVRPATAEGPDSPPEVGMWFHL